MSSKTPDPLLEAWPSVVLDGGASAGRRDVGEPAASAASSAEMGRRALITRIIALIFSSISAWLG